MRSLLILSFICATILSSSPIASACGGYEATPIDGMVEFSELVVSASVEYVDKLAKNVILKVDRYFKGSGGKYLAVVNYRPAVYHADTVRDYDHGCLSIGPWNTRFRKDEYGYFALQANHDGTYGYYSESVWIPGDVLKYRKLESTEGLVEFFLYSRSEYELETPAPVDEFEDLLLQTSNRSETTPPVGNNYPLMRYLNITTESGKRYRLNPDFSVTWLDPAKLPIAISNDGSHVMFRLEMDELAFQYLALVRKELHWCPYCQGVGSATIGGSALSVGAYTYDGWLEPVKGWYATFSPDSNFVAVQERDQLLVYMFDNWSLAEYEYGQMMGMEVVAGQHVWWDPFFGEEPLAWSADSTTIAYQDSRGIWHWDIFEETHPQLILPGDGSKELLDVSKSGRYLRYSHDETWSLIDVETGEIHERAIATPDERNLIFVQPSYPEGTVVLFNGRENHYRKAWRTCQAPLSKCPIHIVYHDEPIDIFEYQPGWIGLVSRNSVELFPWYLSMEESQLRILAEPPAAINAFDYDQIYNVPAIAYGEYTIGLGFTGDIDKTSDEEGLYTPVNLQGELDSPIFDLEWGQPVFLSLH